MTAVEWLYDQIPLTWTIKGSAKKIFEQAKEKEKQQIVNAYKMGFEEIVSPKYENAEQYFTETFKQ